jgi:hypothetical protein
MMRSGDKGLAAVLLFQEIDGMFSDGMRLRLPSCVSICTFVLVNQRRHAAALALLRQYLYFCTSKPGTACGCACPPASAFALLY